MISCVGRPEAMKYNLHPTLWAEIESGSVWLGHPPLPSRTVVRISRKNTNAVVYCEAKIIDEYLVEEYKRSVGKELLEPRSCVLMNAWYRKHLGISLEDKEVELDVVPVDSVYGRTRACLNHPQLAVRLATILALWSLFLSFVGFVLGLLAFM